MFSNVYAKTLRDHWRGLAGWSAGVALTVVMMAAIWPSFSEMDMQSFLDQYPDALKEAFNITSMSTATGYLNAELFSIMFPAMFIIFAVSRGARLVAGEEEDGTLEILAALPISRSRILLEKAAALVTDLAALSLVLLVSLAACSAVVGLEIPVRYALNAVLAMFLLGLEYGLIALTLSAITGRRAVATGVAAGLAGAAYVLYLMAQLLDSIRPYRVLSPFHQAISEGPLGPNLPPIVLAMPVVGLAALAIAVPLFTRRDLAI